MRHATMTQAHTNILTLSFALILYLSSWPADAEGIPETTWLDPENAVELGFSVLDLNGPDSVFAKFVGPANGPNDCPARRSGVAVFDSDDDVVMSSVTEIRSDDESPTALANLADESLRLMLWIDYLCPAERLSHGRRYAIRDLSRFLAKKDEGK